MKKFWFILFALSLFFNHSDAQYFKAFLTGGMNATQIDGDGLGGYDKFGINAGAGVSRSFNEKFGAQFELYYSQKGSKDVPTDNDPTPDSTFIANYIDIPIMFNYYYKRNKLKLKFEVGPYIGVLLNAAFYDNYTTSDKTNEYYRTDIGAGAGIEYAFNDHFSFNLRISHSVMTATKIGRAFYHNVSGLTFRYTI